MRALSFSSTAAQKLVVGQEIDVSPPPAGSMLVGLDHDLPS
jgi:hypothetical protein